MKVVVGIGNPGSRYAKTRHNIGFMSLDFFAAKHDLNFIPSKGDYYHASDFENSFTLIKPTTYVNNSGNAVSHFTNENNVSANDLLVVYDDLNLPLGEVRVRLSGGDGGHNGIHSIIYSLQTEKFSRIRLGIGSDFSHGQMADYVLSEFNPDETETLHKVLQRTNLLIEKFLSGGAKAMLDENSKLNQISNSTEQNIENTIRRD